LNLTHYENELRRGLVEAIHKLSSVPGFVLYSFNIWTDIGAGASAFSADDRANSSAVVRTVNQMKVAMAARMRAVGEHKLAEVTARPCFRNDNPAEFKLCEVVKIEHADWGQLSEENEEVCNAVEGILERTRDIAAEMIPTMLPVEPDAEVTISTRTSWCDRAVPIKRRERGHALQS
jgi:hypothetical protein